MSDKINTKTKTKKIKIVILAMTLVTAILAVGAVAFAMSQSTKKVEKQLSLGEKYLSKLDYEQAITAYELAIEIESKNADAYIGLADVYIAMTDYEKAEEVLDKAKDRVTKEEDVRKIDKKYKRVEKMEEDAKTTQVITEPRPTDAPSTEMEPILSDILSTEMERMLKKASVGEYITFGTYEQDNNIYNGAEPIEWMVLDKKDGKLLVLSRYLLDAKSYNEESVDVTWENCTLRNWLNDKFFRTVFTNEERAHVLETLVKNNDNSEHGTEGGNDTKDRVFLLSVDEMMAYFGTRESREAYVTEYTKEQGAYEYKGIGEWWLRSPGHESHLAIVVNSMGGAPNVGLYVTRGNSAVRPALWISCSEVESASPSDREQVLENAFIGDYISFGDYEQDNNDGNGTEPIEWLVLKKEDRKVLVISRYALDCKKFNEEKCDVTWENCTLRSWLNAEFYYTAFNDEERAAIMENWLINTDNSVHDSESGNNTSDKVFLLSEEEAKLYFDSDVYVNESELAAKVTEYAKAQGGIYCDDESSEYGNGCWWLRTAGIFNYFAAVVDNDYVDCAGFFVNNNEAVVRPALWIAY